MVLEGTDLLCDVICWNKIRKCILFIQCVSTTYSVLGLVLKAGDAVMI